MRAAGVWTSGRLLEGAEAPPSGRDAELVWARDGLTEPALRPIRSPRSGS